MAYNRFGAVYTSVVSLYVGTATADYGTQANIEDAIDRAVDAIVQAMPENVFRALTEPELQMVVRRATAGQTSCTLGMIPVVAGSVHLWAGAPSLFGVRPVLGTESAGYSRGYDGDSVGLPELASSAFTLTAATGGIVLGTGLAADDQVYATYQVDVANASFSMPSLARLAVRGAAAEMGSRLYAQSNQEWALVEAYRQGWERDLEALRAGALVPDEIRALRFWSEVSPSGPRAGSVRLGRGT